MRRLQIIFLCLINLNVFAQEIKHKVYLVSGHGSDIRVYSKIKFPDNVDTIHLHWIKPSKNESMNEYALRMAAKIDTTENYSIVGLSFGGMLACEMSTFLSPENIIIISSASSRKELPKRYKWMKNLEIYRLFSGWFYKVMTKPAQLIFEPDRAKESDIFNAMIHDKDPEFIKRAIHMIVNWEGDYSNNPNVFHIHGSKDHTIPIRNTCPSLIVKNGSHMMLLTEPEILSIIFKIIFEESK